MRSIFKIFFLHAIAVSAFAAYGYYGDAFILASKSSQSIAMGGTGLSSLEGVKSLLSNPAGLAGCRQKEFFTQYRSLFGLASQSSIGFSMPYGKYQVGAMFNMLGVELYRREDILTQIPNINERRDYVRDFIPGEKFYDLESALLLCMAGEKTMKLKQNWSYDPLFFRMQYGATVKIIYKALDGHSALGSGIDAGLRFLIPGDEVFYIKKLGTISFGMNIENFIQSPIIWFDKLRDCGNMRIRSGISLQQPLELFSSELCIALDALLYENNFFPIYGLACGTELRIKKILDIRLGWNISAFSGGIGLHLPLSEGKLRVDYAIQYHEIHWSHLLSLSYYWESINNRRKTGGN